ncbi:hypothetical protein BH23GEM5_BH23GEM5_03150 [soil metagenome]
MLVRFNLDSPLVREVFADEVIPFGLISNNHAGQRKVVVQESPIRVVCANTLTLHCSTGAVRWGCGIRLRWRRRRWRQRSSCGAA